MELISLSALLDWRAEMSHRAAYQCKTIRYLVDNQGLIQEGLKYAHCTRKLLMPLIRVDLEELLLLRILFLVSRCCVDTTQVIVTYDVHNTLYQSSTVFALMFFRLGVSRFTFRSSVSYLCRIVMISISFQIYVSMLSPFLNIKLYHIISYTILG